MSSLRSVPQSYCATDTSVFMANVVFVLCSCNSSSGTAVANGVTFYTSGLSNQVSFGAQLKAFKGGEPEEVYVHCLVNKCSLMDNNNCQQVSVLFFATKWLFAVNRSHGISMEACHSIVIQKDTPFRKIGFIPWLQSRFGTSVSVSAFSNCWQNLWFKFTLHK